MTVQPEPLTIDRRIDMLSSLTATTIALERGFGPGFGPGLGPGLGFLFLLIPLFWIGIIALVIALVGRRWRRNGWAAGGHPAWASRGAEGSLAERFAQGDIDEKEYRGRLEVLRASAGDGRKR